MSDLYVTPAKSHKRVSPGFDTVSVTKQALSRDPGCAAEPGETAPAVPGLQFGYAVALASPI
jgi:hypothetical protein